ncbi:glycosyltransferase [Marinicrinis sediminis]|uniref:Glycosyltransferase n=1 Tax=Marinicrinis sediminis TaxID=1652465 RepID=A0ABW5RCH3_9BACL
MKVAIVHDYLIQMGGAERVVEVLHSMFPQAPIYTTAAVEQSKLLPGLQKAEIRTTWMQRIPRMDRHYKRMLPFYPVAIHQFDLQEFDVVISSSSAFVKGIKVPSHVFHLCYCHTPMRFAWDFDHYMEREAGSWLFKHMLRGYMGYLRKWDQRTSAHVDQFVANSNAVKERIKRCYHRDADVIFPPVETSRFHISGKIEPFYLMVTRLVSYKRIDLAIDTFNRIGLPLRIVGGGPDLLRLKKMAKPNIQFLGRLSDEEVNRLMSTCKAFIFPGEEDFGITPLEVNAAGRPVIAYEAGGALDTIRPELNGIYFREQTPESLARAVKALEWREWDSNAIRQHARSFDVESFKYHFQHYLVQKWSEFKERTQLVI